MLYKYSNFKRHLLKEKGEDKTIVIRENDKKQKNILGRLNICLIKIGAGWWGNKLMMNNQ